MRDELFISVTPVEAQTIDLTAAKNHPESHPKIVLLAENMAAPIVG